MKLDIMLLHDLEYVVDYFLFCLAFKYFGLNFGG